MSSKDINECDHQNLGVSQIADKARESQLIWFSQLQQRPITAPLKMSDMVQIEDINRTRGSQK